MEVDAPPQLTPATTEQAPVQKEHLEEEVKMDLNHVPVQDPTANVNVQVEDKPKPITINGTITDEENAVMAEDLDDAAADHPEPLNSECLDDPNFAIICSFIDKFGATLKLDEIGYDELQAMLETTVTVPEPLVKLHVVLLRRVFKSIVADKWERSLAKFGHTYCSQDAWEIERFGYRNAKLQTKLRFLKHLLEAQFDFNVKFKAEVNKLEAGDLRIVPLGRDSEGQLYWYQVDNDANLRVYREDVDDESWEIVAYTREGLCELISKLQHGDVKKPEEAVVIDEDSNEKEIETKEILRDTGKCDEDEEQDENSCESELGGVNNGEEGNSESQGQDISDKTVKPAKDMDVDIPPAIVPKKDEPTVPSSVVKCEVKETVQELTKTFTSETEIKETNVSVALPTLETKVATVCALESKTMEVTDSAPVKSEPVKVEVETLVPVVEEPIVKTVAWVCGSDTEKPTPMDVDVVEDNKLLTTKQTESEPVPEKEDYDSIKSTPALKEQAQLPEDTEKEDSANIQVVSTLRKEEERQKSLEKDDKDKTSTPQNLPVVDSRVPEVATDSIALKIKDSAALAAEETVPQTADVASSSSVELSKPEEIKSEDIPAPIQLSKSETIKTEDISAPTELPKPEEVKSKYTFSPVELSQPEGVKSKDISAPIELSKPEEAEKTQPSSPPEGLPIKESSEYLSKIPSSSHDISESDNAQVPLEKPKSSTSSSDEPLQKPEVTPAPVQNSVGCSASQETQEIKVDTDTSSASNETEAKVEQNFEPTPMSEEVNAKPVEVVANTVPVQPECSKDPEPTIVVVPSKPNSKPAPSAFSGLVSYGTSSDEDETEDEESKTNNISEIFSDNSNKRKAESSSATAAVENGKITPPPTKIAKLEEPTANPIVGEAVEEEMMIITGEGSGAACEGGNAVEIQKENVDHTEEDSQESQDTHTPTKRGRGRPGRKKGATTAQATTTTPKQKSPNKTTGSSSRGRKFKELESLGVAVPLDTLEINGSGGDAVNERPVRASRRIAQIRLKEEEERRKQEEEHLAQLKAAQLRKQQRKAENELKKSKSGGSEHSGGGGDYAPSPSSSDSEQEEDHSGEDFAIHPDKKKKKKKRKKGKTNGKPGRPWATDSSDDDEEAVEEEEEYHYEEEDHDNLVFNNSDHEFSPESDLGEDEDARPSRHARTAKRGEVEEEETGCKKCGKGDHPEWILLCDKCDHGWHASCLRPQLWVIPEGEWYCPPCQHLMLVTKLNENLVEYDKLLKRRENEVLKKKRLTFVGISVENVLPQSENVQERREKSRSPSRKERKREKRRRRILSDEELSDHFVASDNSGVSRSQSSEEDSDGPIYRLRTRRAAKTFDYKAYDDMINSACRASDEEYMEEAEVLEEAELDEDENVNGNVEAEATESPELTGKEKAYAKHMESAKEEEPEEKEKKEAAATVGEEEESDDEELDEKEKKRLKELKKASGNKRKKRSFRDLDDFSDEDNSDEDFRGSDVEDDEDVDDEAAGESEESDDWSGDKDSDDSLAARAKDKGKKGKYGRRDEYLEVGAVRRSTRAKRKSRVSYDESDQEDDDEDDGPKWNSEESDEEDEETPSESDDETYGKQKRKKAPPKSKSSTPRFFLGASITKKSKKGSSSGIKKKKKRVDDEDVDRAWSSSQGSKAKKSAAEEKVERRTRGRKINFKDILDSGESDDDGNVLPKRRRLSDDEDEDEAETSRRLAEKIKAANQLEAARYALQKQKEAQLASGTFIVPSETPAEEPVPVTELEKELKAEGEAMPKLEKMANTEMELALAKPVLAPPLPPMLAKAIGQSRGSKKSKESKSSKSKEIDPSTTAPAIIPPPVTTASEAALIVPVVVGPPSSMPPIMSIPQPPLPPTTSSSSSSSSNKKGSRNTAGSDSHSSPSRNTPPISHSMTAAPNQQKPMVGMPQGLPAGIPLDISRVPNPSLFQGNPGMRPFHPMWVRNPGPPPYGSGGSPPTSIGKPPPLNSPAFMSQHPSRPGYPSPPPLRIPNPSNAASLQAFQHFRRDVPPGGPHGPLYRLPPGQQPPAGLSGILAGFQGSPERFFGAPNPYSPYGILPPHPQGQPPQGLFGVGASPFDFRPGAEAFKDEPPRGAHPTSTPPPPSSSHPHKDELPAPVPPQPSESEFGGLVSYFSSQRTEDDMET